MILTQLMAVAAFSCPSVVQDSQHLDIPAGADSVRYSPGPRRLENMVAFVGHPSKRLQPEPDGWSKKGVYTWRFVRGQDIWVECTYQDSAAVITFHVGAVSKCTFFKSHGGLQPSTGRCEAVAP